MSDKSIEEEEKTTKKSVPQSQGYKDSTFFFVKNKKLLISFGIILVLIFLLVLVLRQYPNQNTATTSFDNSQTTNTKTSEATPETDTQISTDQPVAFTGTQYFTGKIDRNNVALAIRVEGENIEGYYSYNHFNTPISIKGIATKADDKVTFIELEEFKDSKVNANFELNLEKESPDSINYILTGLWTPIGAASNPLDVMLYSAFPQNIYLSGGQQNNIEIKPETNLETTDKYSIERIYPIISKTQNQEVQKNINDKLSQIGKLETIKNEFDQLSKSIAKEATVSNNPEPEIQNELFSDEINYHINYNQNDVLSVEFSGYKYTGGAHGNPFIGLYNFNLKNGNQLRLKDIFKDNSDYLNKLSELSTKKLLQLYPEISPEIIFNEGLKPEESNFENFSFTPNGGINITFEAYQVLAYAFGTPSINFTVDELKDILKPEYNFQPTPIFKSNQQ